MINQPKLHFWGNFLGLLFICISLAIAFCDQLISHDLPCPLCLLQRLCFIATGLALCMNIRYGSKPAHYGLMLLSALCGLSISVRQLFLHIAPQDPGYGGEIWGLHLYAWSAIIFIGIITTIAIALLFDEGFTERPVFIKRWVDLLMSIFLVLILANSVSTFIECGFTRCPDNPVAYYLLGQMP
ncbi:disulfide bond formation protein B [Legionella dresdenensis]|uniref:Disulfide bond formation protein B n=1 Tax=Legionella dresdenensis TaxID=450200 RepID=A0ABV8CEA7_9GAMM